MSRKFRAHGSWWWLSKHKISLDRFTSKQLIKRVLFFSVSRINRSPFISLIDMLCNELMTLFSRYSKQIFSIKILSRPRHEPENGKTFANSSQANQSWKLNDGGEIYPRGLIRNVSRICTWRWKISLGKFSLWGVQKLKKVNDDEFTTQLFSNGSQKN